MGNYHVRFWNGGGEGDRSTDRSAADRPVEDLIEVSFAFERVFSSFFRCFSRAAADARSVGRITPSGGIYAD